MSTRRYLVLASQRSGSTLLVESLKQTGIAGHPAEYFQYLPETGLSPQPRQWFAGVHDESVLRLLAPLRAGTPITETSEEFRDRVLAEGSTPNGVWGGKLMWNQAPLLIQRARRLSDSSGPTLRDAIRDVIGDDVLFIHVSRPDIVHQAVSFWKAVQTQTWRADIVKDNAPSPKYHATGIGHLHRILNEQEQGWQKWFADEGITPLTVSYAELARDSRAVTARVLTALGLDPSAAPHAPLERQADVRSNTWVERYLIDAATTGQLP
ncbi:trehalose 2-sulfotransferase [Smaragdicoccus niigatensis]|uniref:trehalose 2-sulfotransferase n=1 Tax=Smaragdicoccus niigatensis TaxID=359359 RepID=UPI00037A7F45|nr:Stf0 family sulfotransferase [Smaragdicoccus niigatensis]